MNQKIILFPSESESRHERGLKAPSVGNQSIQKDSEIWQPTAMQLKVSLSPPLIILSGLVSSADDDSGVLYHAPLSKKYPHHVIVSQTEKALKS